MDEEAAEHYAALMAIGVAGPDRPKVKQAACFLERASEQSSGESR
jgi:hypothetical protein